MAPDDAFIHPNAEVDAKAEIGPRTKVWDWAKVREGARIGADCILGQGTYVDAGAIIGDSCKIQNGVSVYNGVVIGDRVFVGPSAVFTNDRVPRAHATDWRIVETRVEDGASIGANATIVCGVTLGAHCMVAAGAVVTRDVPRHGLVMGNPARLADYVDVEGRRLNWDVSGPPPDSRQLADNR